MTYLLLQTFLLLLSSYFFGAFLACMTKRAVMARTVRLAPVTARTTAAPVVVAPTDIVPLTKPRDIDPVQPKIDILPRPGPTRVPVTADVDISRFDRALTGPEPNAGMPRKMIIELRPAILKSPTGPAQPLKPKPAPVAAPKVEAPKIEAPKTEVPKSEAAKTDSPKIETAKPAAPKAEALKAETTKPEPSKPQETLAGQAGAQAAAAQAAASIQAAGGYKPAIAQSVPSTKSVAVEPKAETQASAPAPSPVAAGIAGAAAAAAAAVAAAKAAAASVMPRPVTPAPQSAKTASDSASASPPQSTVTAEPEAKPDATLPAKPVVSETVLKPAATQQQPAPAADAPETPASHAEGADDLLRIRAIDSETARRLHGIGVRRFEDIARWTPDDINRVSQALGLTGRIDREQWIEQAQILAKGGETYYSRNSASASKDSGVAAPLVPASTPAAAQAQSNQPAASPALQPAPTPAAADPKLALTSQQSVASTANLQGKSVSEMAAAAAAAIAAASASITRGIRPIEPISPIMRADPNIVMPAKLEDAIREKDSKTAATPEAVPSAAAKDPAVSKPAGGNTKPDDLKRIRGIGVLIEKRLNTLGVTSYGDVANWTSGDIDRISQTLDFKGRIERENWVEQARILSSGGHTEFSRRVDRGDAETSRDDGRDDSRDDD